MLYRPDGKRIYPITGYISGWKVEQEKRPQADAVATMYTYNTFEPIDTMSKEEEKS